MRKFLAVLACTSVLMAGPCTLESWSVAVSPGIGDARAFMGIELDFGDVEFVVPITTLGN